MEGGYYAGKNLYSSDNFLQMYRRREGVVSSCTSSEK